jgi:hypothetical protein
MFKKLLAFLILLPTLAWGDGVSIGAGKLLNNSNGQNPGYLADATYIKGPWQVSGTRVYKSYLGDEINISLIYRHSWGKWSLGGGAIVAQSYSVPDWWFGAGREQAWGLKAQCLLCGFAAQAAYKITPKVELQLRYWGTDRFLIPSHNGALAVLSYSL